MNLAYYDLPVFLRILIAISCLILIMLGEKVLKREKAFRWKGYCLWLVMSVFGLIFGFALDLLTIHLSPEYYRIGKCVAVDNLWLTSLNVGGAAGFLAGALMGGFILMRNKDLVTKSETIPWRILIPTRSIFIMATVGIAIAYIVPLIVTPSPSMSALLTPEQIKPFFQVQQIHAGAYLGAAIGFLFVVKEPLNG
ncbi:MAG: hypothetical protein EOP07_08605 [Proteobacteria bacterium]|nr:MAG: hypothetical protein EOP07_08605 [Pseudomonadota bacterium]